MRYQELLEDAFKAIGPYLRNNAYVQNYEWKYVDDPVTEIDKSAERQLKEFFLNRLPANFLGEEYGLENNGAEHTFIIDPIDGTKSYIRKDFASTVSIAIEKNGELVAGGVYDFMRDIAYIGTDKNVVLYGGKEVNLPGYSSNYISVFMDPEDNSFRKVDTTKIRPMIGSGSYALKLAQVAVGIVGGIVGPDNQRSNPWDVAAGYKLLLNAGVPVTDRYGKPYDYYNAKGIVASKANLEKLL